MIQTQRVIMFTGPKLQVVQTQLHRFSITTAHKHIHQHQVTNVWPNVFVFADEN